MPRPRYPYLHREVTRHGRVVWYFKRAKGSTRVRIDGDFGSPEFRQAYEAALIGNPIERRPPVSLPRRKTTNARSYVYFAQCDLLVKIGVSKTPSRRAEALQIGSASTLRIIKKIPGDLKVEREMHKRFSKYRVRGEWFRMSGELAAYLTDGGYFDEEGAEIIL